MRSGLAFSALRRRRPPRPPVHRRLGDDVGGPSSPLASPCPLGPLPGLGRLGLARPWRRPWAVCLHGRRSSVPDAGLARRHGGGGLDFDCLAGEATSSRSCEPPCALPAAGAGGGGIRRSNWRDRSSWVHPLRDGQRPTMNPLSSTLNLTEASGRVLTGNICPRLAGGSSAGGPAKLVGRDFAPISRDDTKVGGVDRRIPGPVQCGGPMAVEAAVLLINRQIVGDHRGTMSPGAAPLARSGSRSGYQRQARQCQELVGGRPSRSERNGATMPSPARTARAHGNGHRPAFERGAERALEPESRQAFQPTGRSGCSWPGPQCRRAPGGASIVVRDHARDSCTSRRPAADYQQVAVR